MKQIYILEGLDCPNCAAKIEREVGELAFVRSSKVNLMQQTLTLDVNDGTSDIKTAVETIVHAHEPDVTVHEKAAHAHDHGEDDPHGMIARLIIGGVLFVVGIILTAMNTVTVWSLVPLIAAYIVLGYDVVFAALSNIVKGRVFDENFLMSLSTVGAFVIGEYPEAVAVMLFYQIGELFQSAAVRRSRRSIAQLMDIRPDTATVLRDGQETVVSPETVAIGESIVVRPGDKLPLDGVVISGSSTLDTAALTGESVPRTVSVGDAVLSGCINESGVLTMQVTKSFSDSTASKILELVENAAANKAPTENFITSFARYYTPAVVIAAVCLAVLPPLFIGGWSEWIRRAFVFLVVSCPCALVISVPLTFFGGIGAASRHGVLVKGGNYLEALSRLDTVVFDKTGTLTKGEFAVRECRPAEGVSKEELLSFATAVERFSTHPIARSILACAGENVPSATDHREIAGKGVCATVNGKAVAVGSAALMDTLGVTIPSIEAGGTVVYVAADTAYLGCLVIADEIKADSKAAITALRQRGVSQTVMLTGDSTQTAEAVGKELGIDRWHAQLLPADKVQALEAIAHPRGTLAFVGDGINDAPVLARADIGIAMGALGSDAAIEAADVVLMTDEPSKLCDALDIAKATKRIVLQNIVFALGIKALFLVLGAFGIAGMWEAVFGDVGVAVIAILNAMRMLKK